MKIEMINVSPAENKMSQIQVTNQEFLQAIFGDDWGNAHVTAFRDDPTNIAAEYRARCWAGGPASNKLSEVEFIQAANCNQYFSISLFRPDTEGIARRRKEFFEATYVVVADDVKDKIPEELASRLPLPSYRLETSPGNEQWGWILDTPCASREQIDNLLNGLVSQGLSPDGKDPGMKGVTRYVRLPAGCNTKAKYRKDDGSYPRCRIMSWNPDQRVSLKQLAKPFDIDLDKPCSSTSKSIEIHENAVHHPLFQMLTQHGQITSAPTNGWYSIKDCPNSSEHSSSDTSGAAIVINTDGTFGFKCHHGHCSDEIDATKALEHWNTQYTGIKQEVEEFIAEAQRQNFQAQLLEQSQNTPGPSSSGVRRYKQKLADFFSDPAIVQITGQSSNEIISKYLVKVMYGGKSMIAYVVRNPKNGNISHLITRFSELQDFLSGVYAFDENDRIILTMGGSPIHILSRWKTSPGTKTYNGITLNPIANTYAADYKIVSDERELNYWTGISIKPEVGKCDLIKNHIYHIWCAGDNDRYQYVMSWLARLVQQPELPGETAIVLRSGEGTGKNIIADELVKIFGSHGFVVTSTEHLAGRFNNHLAKSVLVFANEAMWGGDKSKTGNLKSLITDKTLTIEEKFKDIIMVPNCIHLIMATNNDWAIPAGMDDRRYLVLDVSETRKRDFNYFEELVREIKNGGISAFLHELLQIDLRGFNHRDIPKNQGASKLLDQLKTANPIASLWFDTLNSPETATPGEQTGMSLIEWNDWINGGLRLDKDQLYSRYLTYCTNHKIPHPSNKAVFYREFTQLFNRGETKTYEDLQKRVEGNRIRMLEFANLACCRLAFRLAFGGVEIDWDEPI